MIHAITLFLLFILPFIYLPFMNTPFEPPKVFVAEFLIQLLLVITVWKWKKITVYKPALIALGVIAFIGIWNLIQPHEQLIVFGNVFRLQGTVLMVHLMAFALVGQRFKPKNISWMVPFIAIVLLLLSALFIPPNQSGRYIGTLGEPNALAAVAVVLFPFVFFYSSRKIKIITALLVTTLLYLTGSHSGLIAFCIELLFVILYRRQWRLRSILAICFICVALSYALPMIDVSGVFENRLEIWKTGILAGDRYPFTGSGFGNAENVMRTIAKANESPVQYAYVDSAHNIFIDWFIQTGLIGLSAFMFLMVSAVKAHTRSKHIPALVAFVGYITMASFNPLSVCSLVFLWWFLGEGIGVDER